jgi:hypothetical protein
MHPDIEMRWKKLEASKQQFVSLLSNKRFEAHAQPLAGWSLAQVVEHLLASEGGTWGYMRKKSSGGWEALEDASAEHHEKSRAIIERLQSDERYLAPDILPQPTNAIALHELLAQWDEQRQELLKFIREIQPNHYHKLVFRQPAAGMLTVLHALEFMEAHLRHHMPQAERLLNE